MDGADALGEFGVGPCAGRQRPLAETSSTRHCVAIGNMTGFSLTNRKTHPAPCRSPEQTGPRLLRGCRVRCTPCPGGFQPAASRIGIDSRQNRSVIAYSSRSHRNQYLGSGLHVFASLTAFFAGYLQAWFRCPRPRQPMRSVGAMVPAASCWPLAFLAERLFGRASRRGGDWAKRKARFLSFTPARRWLRQGSGVSPTAQRLGLDGVQGHAPAGSAGAAAVVRRTAVAGSSSGGANPQAPAGHAKQRASLGSVRPRWPGP